MSCRLAQAQAHISYHLDFAVVAHHILSELPLGLHSQAAKNLAVLSHDAERHI